MLSVDEARSRVLAATALVPAESISLAEAAGRVLRQSIVSPIDAPPFDKALMDGFAVRSSDFAAGGCRTLHVVEVIAAGDVPAQPLKADTCARIMTGAPLPDGADAVVRVEDSAACLPDGSLGEPGSGFAVDPGGRVLLRPVSSRGGAVLAGTNMLRRGTAMRAGEMLFEPGRRIRPQEIAVLAEAGFASVAVARRPVVAILATGDELVPVGAECRPGCIRNSNELMLAAQVLEVGAVPRPLGIVRDDPVELRAAIAEGLQADVLLLSGGVSAGQRDFVPAALRDAGAVEVFHKVRLKPGKPLWFGVRNAFDSEVQQAASAAAAGRDDGASTYALSAAPAPAWAESRGAAEPHRTLIFGLPGNPVSSMVCCELFVKPALRRMLGIEPPEGQILSGVLSSEFRTRGDRPTYYPARLTWADAGAHWEVEPVAWHGSADIRGAARANAMIAFPAGDAEYGPGDRVSVLPWGAWAEPAGELS